MPTLKQGLIVTAGVLVAAVMVVLGLWQMSSYRHTGLQVAIDRTKQEPVVLVDNVASDGTVADIYARRVTVEGTYRPEGQILVGITSPLRVVTALQTDDGRVVAVVRGATSDNAPPAPPSGRQQITGIFLASDPVVEGEGAATAGRMGSVRLARLAQEWDGRVIAGYVTLPEADSRAQGLAPADVPLPEVQGSAQHSGYAMQWWVFAAAAIGASVWIARGVGRSPAAASPQR